MDEIIRKMGTALPSLVLITGLLAGQTNIAFAHDPGRAGDDRGTAGCSGCHSGGTAGTTVAFGAGTGNLPASVAVNSVNTFTFKISGGPASNAGLSVHASAGMLAATAADSTVGTAGELFHTAAATMTAGSKTYTFTWTAPAISGPVTLTGAGVSGNADGSSSLDGAAKITATIDVTGGANIAPIARITGPSTGTVGTAVSFDGSTSSDADGTIATYAWNFGDNTAGASATPPAHTYAAPGTYHVTLIVTDNLGLASMAATHDIVISAVGAHLAPVANANGPYTGTVGAPVVFSSAGSSVDSGLTATYSWDFGDASTPATVANPSHTYLTAGTFAVKLTVTDNAATPLSTTVSTNATISAVTPPPPPASTGQQLYDTNCASCHGPKAGPAGSAGSVVGASASDIREAIKDVPTMQSLNTLISAEIVEISAYLKSDAGGGNATNGEKLYDTNCASCHGPKAGPAGTAGSVVGESAANIREAIKEVPTMQSLSTLTATEVADIAAYLKSDGSGGSGNTSNGEKLYEDNCASCHGPTAGPAGAAGSVVGASAGEIREAIREVPTMQSLNTLKPTEVADIAAYLRSGSGGGGKEDISVSQTTDSAGAPVAAAGALDWLSLFGAGAWGLSRRRRK